MKKILLIPALAIFLVFLGGCDSKQSQNESTKTKKEVLKIGTSGGYFPFSFYKNDKLQGFEIDIFNAIAQEMDMEAEFVTAKFSGLFGLLETGKIDTIANQITITKKREEKYTFSAPYVYDGAHIVVHKDTQNINSFADLKGKKVGVSLGTNYEELLKAKDVKHEINIVPYDGEGHKQDTIIKRIDAYVEDKVSATQGIKEHNLPLKVIGTSLNQQRNAFPFLKNSKSEALVKKINQALEKLQKNETLATISKKWLDADITRP